MEQLSEELFVIHWSSINYSKHNLQGAPTQKETSDLLQMNKPYS